MNRFRFLISAVLLAGFLPTVFADSKPPNILFVFTDDLGWGDLGMFYQNESQHDKSHRTPHLDRMARGGLQMRAHYCPAPVCAPSRSSLLTGVHQGNAVVRNNQFDRELEDNHTLGTVLQAAGYRTCMVGKYGLQGGDQENQQEGTPDDWPSYPTRRGFDEYFGYVSHYAGHLHYPNDPWELADERHRVTANVWHSDESGNHEVSESLSKCYTTDLFTARAKHFMIEHQKTRGDQPFFLMLNYDTPHAALQVPTSPYPEGGGVDGGLQWTGGDDPDQIAQPAINTAVGEVDSYRHPDYVGHGWSDTEERFSTMVRRIDSAVGDLNETLEELGIAENTMVIFTSDNGPHHETYLEGDRWGEGRYTPQSFQSYGPFDGTKRDCWEGGIRMPTLAWWKGTIEPNRIDSTPSQFQDWMATFCDVAGIPAPARCDGVSLVPTLTGDGEQAEGTVYIEYENNGKTPDYPDFLESRRGKKRKQMQVLRHRGEDGKLYKGVRVDIASADDDFEIYDLESDPDEAHDLAGTSDAMDRLQNQIKARVLQLRHANSMAVRPYDDAPIPGVTDAPDGFKVVAIPLPGDVDYVPQVHGGSPSTPVVVSADGQSFSWTAPEPGVYQITGSVPVSDAGVHQLTLATDGSAFVRLHDGHAIDVPDANAKATHSAKRRLGVGRHPVTVTVRAERPGTKLTFGIAN